MKEKERVEKKSRERERRVEGRSRKVREKEIK